MRFTIDFKTIVKIGICGLFALLSLYMGGSVRAEALQHPCLEGGRLPLAPERSAAAARPPVAHPASLTRDQYAA